MKWALLTREFRPLRDKRVNISKCAYFANGVVGKNVARTGDWFSRCREALAGASTDRPCVLRRHLWCRWLFAWRWLSWRWCGSQTLRKRCVGLDLHLDLHVCSRGCRRWMAESQRQSSKGWRNMRPRCCSIQYVVRRARPWWVVKQSEHCWAVPMVAVLDVRGGSVGGWKVFVGEWWSLLFSGGFNAATATSLWRWLWRRCLLCVHCFNGRGGMGVRWLLLWFFIGQTVTNYEFAAQIEMPERSPSINRQLSWKLEFLWCPLISIYKLEAFKKEPNLKSELGQNSNT